MRQKIVNQIFNPHGFFFFLFTGATWYCHAFCIVFIYFASFTGYEYDILKVISNLHVQGSKFGGKFDKVGGKSFLKIELRGVHEDLFFQVCLKYPKSIQKSISKVFQSYLTSVSKKFQKSPNITPKVFQKYPNSIPKVSQKDSKSIPKESQKFLKSILKVSLKYPKSISKVSRKYPKNLLKLPQITPTSFKKF